MGVTAGGTLRYTFADTGLTTTVPILYPDGTASAPSISFSGDTNVGLYRAAADTIGFTAAGAQVGTLDSGGQMCIFGTTAAFTPADRANNGQTASFYLSSGTLRLWKSTTGDVITHDGTNPSFVRGTTSSTTTARWNGNALQAPTSTKKLKNGIRALTGDLALAVLDQVRPVRFFWNPLPGDTDDLAKLRSVDEQVGFIAEWMADVSAPFSLAEYMPAGGFPLTPDGLEHDLTIS